MVILLAALTFQTLPDRSGEADFRTLLTTLGAIKSAQIGINRSARESKGGAFMTDREAQVWYADGSRYRILECSYWGDSQVLISDGKTAVQDPCDDSQPLVLRNGTNSIGGSSPDFEAKGPWGFALFDLLRGLGAFDQIVAKDGFIRRMDDRLELQTKTIGTMTIWLKDGLPSRVEYDNRPALEAAYKENPEWNAPVDDPMVREDIVFKMNQKIDSRLLDTTVPKGRVVEDKRKAKPPTFR